MVLKKRCDFCFKIKPDNIQIEEKIFNRHFKDVLTSIAGVEVTSEQLANILTCYDCAILILQAEPTLLKVRTLLTKLSKSKIKKKPQSSSGNADSRNASALEHSVLHESDEVQNGGGGGKEVAKTPAKIKSRRKTIATTVLNTSVNDELDGMPVASSTLKFAEKKSKPKPKTKGEKETTKTHVKKAEGSPKTEGEPTTPPKSLKQKILEQERMIEAATVPNNKADGRKSPVKSTQKRTISQSSRESIEAVHTFKKLKDLHMTTKVPQNVDLMESQDSLNGENLQECLECGKLFRNMEKYQRHVLSQKCKLASYSCRHADCSRRFFKLEKMQEHYQKKHQKQHQHEVMP